MATLLESEKSEDDERIPMVTLICGWKRTGKDTLAYQFNSHPEYHHLHRLDPSYNNPMLTSELSDIPIWNWFIYARPNISKERMLLVQPGQIISFAQTLKQMVLTKLKLPETTDVEKIKDTMIRDDKTFRDFLIEVALEKKTLDQNYFVKKALDNTDVFQPIIITDFRFEHEYDYIKTIHDIQTVRVFRKDVPIPTDLSEVGLNDFSTDYILVPKIYHDEEFAAIGKLLPQYRTYVPASMKITLGKF